MKTKINNIYNVQIDKPISRIKEIKWSITSSELELRLEGRVSWIF